MDSNLSRFRDWAKGLARAISGVSPKTEITIETDQLLVIRRRRSFRGWCRECGCEVEMVRLSEVQAETGKSHLDLQEGSLPQGWHISQDAKGDLLVCLESLMKSL